jgi:hypothetical protein
MGRGWIVAAFAAWLSMTSTSAAQLHGRFHVELTATSREARLALVGVSHQVESALARCATHTHGAASTTRVTLRFTSAGHLRAIAATAVEGEPAPTDAFRTCAESAIHGMTLPTIHDPELIVTIHYEPAAHTPDLSMEAAAAAVTYPEEWVGPVVHEHREEVAHCYELTRAQHATAAGVIRMHITLAADGTVSAATATTDEPGIPSLTTCVITALRRWTFPPPPGGAAGEVDYPLVFARSGG